VDQCPQITHGKECNHNLQKRPVPKRSGAPVAKQNKTKQNKTKQKQQRRASVRKALTDSMYHDS